MLSRDIFREYDIRGIPGKNLSLDDAYHIARAFCMHIRADKAFVCVGRDGRLTSPDLAQYIQNGIRDSGLDVVDIGVCPTPMLYYAAYSLQAAAAIMVTGSHNPPTHNGMKFVLAGKPFFGKDIKALHAVAEKAQFDSPEKGHSWKKELMTAYVGELRKAYHKKDAPTVAWDAGNGAAGEVMTQLCQQLPGNHIVLNAKIDGSFPAHHPDPSVAENLLQLVEVVKENNCAMGIAFDGDADRIGVVDDEGLIIWPDQLMILYARGVLEKYPGSVIIGDVKCSSGLFDDIKKHGGQPLMWKTGHSHIKAKLAETKAKLAGEMSGHIFFADEYYGYDDGLYAAVRLLDIVSGLGMRLSEWRRSLPSYVSTPEIRFDCEESRKFSVIEEVATRLKKLNIPFIDVDGVRRNTEKGWWLLRASNTQPALVARCEAKNQASLNILMNELKAQLTASDIDLPSAA